MDSNINVKYGLIDFGKGKESEECALGSLSYILEDIKDVKKRYVTLGFHLHEFLVCEYFKDFGYSNFNDFCENNIPLDKSAISRCINVWSAFCEIQGCSRKMWLDKDYEKYSYSQLQEMLPLTIEERKLISPDMSVREIRELKKSMKEENKKEYKNATSQFCLDKLNKLNGAAKNSYIKAANAVGSVIIDIYDVNGNYVGGNFWMDNLYFREGHMIVRLYTEDNPYIK